MIVIPPLQFTPHARGSTWIRDFVEANIGVYPACAGIDPSPPMTTIVLCGLPRMRGDRPESAGGGLLHRGFTPHARGSTLGC